MASRRRKKRKLPAEPIEVEITSLAHDGRGIARVEGKTVFVYGAIEGERVKARYVSRYRQYDVADAVEILQSAEGRVTPRCDHFGQCGGCSLQHIDSEVQVAIKQRLMLEQLENIGDVKPEEVFEPLESVPWGYRRKARLGVRNVPKKGRVLGGFRERHSNYVAELSRCDVLIPPIGGALLALSELIGGLTLKAKIPQIEVAFGDTKGALVFRNLEQPTQEDIDLLKSFAMEHDLQVLLQPAGPDLLVPIWPEHPELWYELPQYQVRIEFRPTDFTQVNSALNHKMVDRALELLQPGENDRVLDLFCGLGNFTLPLARRCGEVVGVEGDAGLIERARQNAASNRIENASFYAADLTDDHESADWLEKPYDKLLLDPPRSGALEVLPSIPKIDARRIVYVSCNPATLARDVGELVHRYRYRLLGAGVMDMFPHTGHVESIAVFERV